MSLSKLNRISMSVHRHVRVLRREVATRHGTRGRVLTHTHTGPLRRRKALSFRWPRRCRRCWRELSFHAATYRRPPVPEKRRVPISTAPQETRAGSAASEGGGGGRDDPPTPTPQHARTLSPSLTTRPPAPLSPLRVWGEENGNRVRRRVVCIPLTGCDQRVSVLTRRRQPARRG